MAETLQYRESYHPYSKAKANKHLTERRRRARINDSLLQLKSMVFPAVQDDLCHGSKMEKADILEMTLRYVKDIQKQCQEGTKPSVDQYQAGFSECLGQVSRFMSSCKAIDLDTRMQLLNHLANRSTTRPVTPEPAVSSTTQCTPRQSHNRVPKLHPETNVFVVQSLETPTLHHVSPVPKMSPSPIGGTTPCYTLSPVSFTTYAAQHQSSMGLLKVKVADSSMMLTPPQSPVMPTQCQATPTHPAKMGFNLDAPKSSTEKSVWRPW